MRIEIPEFAEKKDLFSFLKENKNKLINQKKSTPIHSETVSYMPNLPVTKSNEPVEDDVDKLRVKVVANAANVLDSHMDVLIPGCYDKTIEERKGLFVHLHDHEHKVMAKVGEVQDVYTEQVKLTDLGIEGKGTTECMIFETEIQKALNETVFNQYKDGKINQHSIGLSYSKIDLAINDEDSEKEKEFFDKYVDQIINPERALENGFFWVVQEIVCYENSAVLFGSNPATPTLDNNLKKKTVREDEVEEKLYSKRDVQRLKLLNEQLKLEAEIS